MKRTQKAIWEIYLMFVAAVLTNYHVSAADTGWYQEDGGWKYYVSESVYAAGDWQQIGGKWYYFDEDGYMKTGWQEIREDIYSASDETPASFSWYYFKDDGSMACDEWIKTDGSWYYLLDSGRMIRGCNELINGRRYCFREDGSMAANGWWRDGTSWVYANADGSLVADGFTPDGYYMNDRGYWEEEEYLYDNENFLIRGCSFLESLNGGITVKISWENKVNKVIRYMRFNCYIFDETDTMLASEIGNKKLATLYQTGMFGQGQGNYYTVSISYGLDETVVNADKNITYEQYLSDQENGQVNQCWTNVWYNPSVHKVLISSVEIEYIDGTVTTVKDINVSGYRLD